MEQIKYPVLYFPMGESAFFGLLVGTRHQAVGKDVRHLKQIFTNHLKREYKKTGDYPEMDMLQPRMKIVKVNVRPTERHDYGVHPFPYSFLLSMPVFHGKTEFGYYECYLPLLNGYLTYYDENQLEPLASHYIMYRLDQFPPNRVFQFLRLATPQVDTVILKVNEKREGRSSEPEYQRDTPTLRRLAEAYPPARGYRRQRTVLPDVAWERAQEVEEVLEKLLSTRSNVLIVGGKGSGKSAVLQQSVRKMVQQTRRQSVKMSCWRIDAQRITASSLYLGEWEETVEELIRELNSVNGILWVESIIRLLEVGGSGPEDSVAAFLRGSLQQGKVQMIGEATPKEVESMRRVLPGFIEHFQLVQLDALTAEQVFRILQQLAEYTAQNVAIEITEEAQQLAYRLLNRYMTYENFPGKAVKFLGQCLNDVQLQERSVVDKSDVIRNFITQTGLPEMLLRDELRLDEAGLHRYFNDRIIGQPGAVQQLCEVVKIFKAGLNDPGKPIRTFLFVGPTGVGKTASAKALASYFFGMGQKRSPLIRFDMSEFRTGANLDRLIGYGRQTGQLIKEIRERPFAVLLLDEIEKAHSVVFDTLLNVLDEGMLVDALGRMTNFCNTIIIMTSNLGASDHAAIGYQPSKDPTAQYLSAVRKHFRPEFVNRIDATIMFKALEEADIRKITRRELDAVRQREGFLKKNLQLEFSDALVEQLTHQGFDKRYGARPLLRAITQTVVNPLAHYLLAHAKVKNTTLHLDWDGKLLVRSESKSLP